MLPKRLCLAAMALVLIVACATTPKARYAQALGDFDAAMDSYRYYYSMADPVTQQQWRIEVSPLMMEASRALDAWKLAQTDVTKEQAFINLYRQAMALLFKYGIPAEQEVSQ
jgi:outer membrane lipoprotein-sorting protein